MSNNQVSQYQTIVLAVDLTEESNQVASRVKQLIAYQDCTVHVVHVIEPLSFAYGGDVPMDLTSVQEQIQDQARSHLTEFSQQFAAPPEHQHLIFGRLESEIHRVAEENAADLIVVGSHGRHGLALLFGSTANGVLHGAPCDVLAVRVGTS